MIKNKNSADALAYWNTICDEHDSTIIPPPLLPAADYETNMRNDAKQCRRRINAETVNERSERIRRNASHRAEREGKQTYLECKILKICLRMRVRHDKN